MYIKNKINRGGDVTPLLTRFSKRSQGLGKVVVFSQQLLLQNWLEHLLHIVSNRCSMK